MRTIAGKYYYFNSLYGAETIMIWIPNTTTKKEKQHILYEYIKMFGEYIKVKDGFKYYKNGVEA